MTRVAGVASPRQGARPFTVAVAVTVVLMALSVVAALGWRSQLQGDGREQFDLDATAAQQVVAQRLQSTVNVLQATRSTVDGDPSSVTADAFDQTVAAALSAELPSLASVALVERVAEEDIDQLQADRVAAGLSDFEVLSVDEGGAPPAIATFEASTRAAPILSGYDLRAVPALAEVLTPGSNANHHISPRLEALPEDVLELHPDLGQSAFAMVIPAGPGSWVLALLSGDELAEQAAAVDDELDVALAVGDSPVGASTVRDGRAVDLDAVPSDARTVRPFDIDGGPLLVTVADIDGLAGGGWREPGLLLGAGLALSILVGALVLVLAQGRAGALRVASEAQLARDRSEENFRAVVQHLSDLVLVTDASTMISFVTPSVARLLGREASSLPGGFLGDLVHPDDRALLAALTSRSGVSEKGLIRFRHSDGSDRSFEVVVANRLEDPAIGGLVLTAHDVTDRVKLEDRLAHEATHDDLTGLPNRALIHDRLEHALLRADRTGGRVAVVFGDLDSFKPINDKYGHLIGDRLLQGVARRMRGAARAMDTVGRYGGDEFVVVCEELEDEAGARLAAERLHQEVARPLDVDLTMLDVAMSLGVALAAPGESAESVMHRADQAMYRAKAEQRITFAA
ncbi:MAG TPA: sensor domain-containing diguanylate cyclase [Acidimicrobiales bacterium]